MRLGAPDSVTECADEHKMLVELACATTMVPAYFPPLFERLVPRQSGRRPVVVFVVCGGFKIALEDIAEYQTLLAESLASKPGSHEVFCNGEQWGVAL